MCVCLLIHGNETTCTHTHTHTHTRAHRVLRVDEVLEVEVIPLGANAFVRDADRNAD